MEKKNFLKRITDMTAKSQFAFLGIYAVVICLVCMTGVTFAWFMHSVQVNGGEISASTWQGTVSVTGPTGNVNTGDSGAYTLSGGTDAAQSYTISLGTQSETTGSGYFVITAKKSNDESANVNAWYTGPVSENGDTVSDSFPKVAASETKTITFKIEAGSSYEVTVEPFWGESGTIPEGAKLLSDSDDAITLPQN
mgnify:CR=1 FL=1